MARVTLERPATLMARADWFRPLEIQRVVRMTHSGILDEAVLRLIKHSF